MRRWTMTTTKSCEPTLPFALERSTSDSREDRSAGLRAAIEEGLTPVDGKKRTNDEYENVSEVDNLLQVERCDGDKAHPCHYLAEGNYQDSPPLFIAVTDRPKSPTGR